MTKSDVSSAALTVSPASFPTLQPARRLIVLVPESEMDAAFMARKIWELANTLECGIQFLGLSKDSAHEPGVRRQMVTLSAMVGYENIPVETKIEIGSDWLGMVKSNWREGDVIVCFTGQSSGLARRPLSQMLESNLNATVYVLSENQPQVRYYPRSWMVNVMAWAGSIGIILGFFWLQAKLIQFPKEWVYTVLLYISLFAEAGSIYAWNNLFE
jgi:hypothetical protein